MTTDPRLVKVFGDQAEMVAEHIRRVVASFPSFATRAIGPDPRTAGTTDDPHTAPSGLQSRTHI
ncbi:MAG: hypothetical protein ACRDSP_14015 [Pseudonocardiaceae bacterium]